MIDQPICPFCGTPLRVLENDNRYYPDCPNIGCVLNNIGRYYPRKRYAIDAINNRPIEDAKDKEIETLKNKLYLAEGQYLSTLVCYISKSKRVKKLEDAIDKALPIIDSITDVSTDEYNNAITPTRVKSRVIISSEILNQARRPV